VETPKSEKKPRPLSKPTTENYYYMKFFTTHRLL